MSQVQGVDGDDPIAKMKRLSRDLIEKSAGSASPLSEIEAIERVAKAHPELYAEYYEARRRRGGATD